MKRLSNLSILFCMLCLFIGSNAWSQSDETVYSLAEKQPVYPGGMLALFNFLDGELIYPEEALTKKIEGRVFLEYIVEKDGSLSGFKVLKGIGAGCNEEAIRVFQNCPKWKPGMNDGKIVRVKMAMPIHFKIP